MEIDEKQLIIERGFQAEALLGSETWREVTASLVVQTYDAFTETQPDQVREREEAYWLHRALKAIEYELQARVIDKDRILETQEI